MLEPIFVNAGYGFYDCDIDIDGSNIKFGSFITSNSRRIPRAQVEIFSVTEYSDCIYMYFDAGDFVIPFYVNSVNNHKGKTIEIRAYNVIERRSESKRLHAPAMYHTMYFLIDEEQGTINEEGVNLALERYKEYKNANPLADYELDEVVFRRTVEMFKLELRKPSSVDIIINNKKIVNFIIDSLKSKLYKTNH